MKSEIPQTRLALCREQHQPALMGCAPRSEARPRIVALNGESVDVVHCGAAEAAVADPKPSRFNDRRVDAEACAGAHHGAGILCDVGLEQSKQKGRGRLRHIARESKTLRAEKVIWRIPGAGERTGRLGLW